MLIGHIHMDFHQTMTPIMIIQGYQMEGFVAIVTHQTKLEEQW